MPTSTNKVTDGKGQSPFDPVHKHTAVLVGECRALQTIGLGLPSNSGESEIDSFPKKGTGSEGEPGSPATAPSDTVPKGLEEIHVGGPRPNGLVRHQVSHCFKRSAWGWGWGVTLLNGLHSALGTEATTAKKSRASAWTPAITHLPPQFPTGDGYCLLSRLKR